MQVHIVRSSAPGCEPNCPEWIAAQGRIDAASPSQFKRVFSKLGSRRLPVFIHSGGGSVDDSLIIGRLLRTKALDVFVTKTAFGPCAPTDAACRKKQPTPALLGTPVGTGALCASACAFVLAGGNRRFVSGRGRVGVHQIATYQTNIRVERTYEVTTRQVWGVPVATEKRLVVEKRIPQGRVRTETTTQTYEKVKRYFAEMGVNDRIMPLLLSATNASMRWLNTAELRSTALATDSFDGEQLILGVATPQLGPAPIMSPGPAAPTATETKILPCRLVAGLPVDCAEKSEGSALAPRPQPLAAPALVPGASPGTTGPDTSASTPAR